MEKIKILIAEDIQSTIKIYNKALQDKIFVKQFAKDGAVALKIYEKWQPDIIILDIMMPLLTGYSVLKKIRGSDEFNDKETTVIMSSSKHSDIDVSSCASLGIEGYIVKPFKFKALEAQILEMFTKRYPNKKDLVNCLIMSDEI